MKSRKTKTKQKSSAKKARTVNYPAHYLASVLMSVMILETALFGIASGADWTKSSVEILDVSETLSQTVEDVSLVFQPVVDTVAGINEFYVSAADEMIILLDAKEGFQDVALIWDGVNAFYEEASVQMAWVLDFSSASRWPAAVAGASIER